MQQKIDKYSLPQILEVITPGDKILIVFILALGVCSLIIVKHLRQPGDSVIIEVKGKVEHQLDLDTSQEISVVGTIGKTTIKINQRAVQVIYSDCPQQICVNTGKIHRAGEIIVCVPNKVVVKINGKRKNQFDVITQ